MSGDLRASMRDVQVGQRREVFDSRPKRLQLDDGQRGDALIYAPSWLVAFKSAQAGNVCESWTSAASIAVVRTACE